MKFSPHFDPASKMERGREKERANIKSYPASLRQLSGTPGLRKSSSIQVGAVCNWQ